MKFTRNDGGRSEKFKGHTGDCVVRAIAIASEVPYSEVYAELFERNGGTPRNGSYPKAYKPYLEELGFIWTPTMVFGKGCSVHVREDELPEDGRHILRLSKHLSAWIDGTLHDTFDCSRRGTRCVYGYWTAT